jgi:hypothetical protein
MPPHRKRLQEDEGEEERKPFAAASSGLGQHQHQQQGSGSGSGSASGSNGNSGTPTTQASSSSSSAASTPSRPLARRRQQQRPGGEDRGGEDEGEGNGAGGGGGGGNGDDNTPWPPAEEMRYWAVSRTLRLAALVAFLGLVQALLSAEAIFWLVLCLASLTSLAALGYAHVRERGLLEFLPPSTQQLLLETSLLDWLMDTSMADRLKPYAALSFGGLNAEERAFLVSSLPRDQQHALVAPGLLHALPAVRAYMRGMGVGIDSVFGLDRSIEGGGDRMV